MSLALLAIFTLSHIGAQASDIPPIGVKVELSSELILSWSNAEKSDVIAHLTEKLITELKRKHQHWDFVAADTAGSPVELAVSTISRGPNEIMLEIELRLYAPANPPDPAQLQENYPLSDLVLYKPGQFIIEGRPSSSKAKSYIWEKAKALIEDRQKANADTLSSAVPVARNPTPIQTDRSLVLPLRKERYSHLAWSEFRLDCLRQNAPEQSVKLSSKADNKWRAFDASMPLALIVVITDNLPTSELQELTPALVFLKKFVPPEKAYIVFGEPSGRRP